jgi:chemotaxis protein methyltransferase CheR
MMTDHQSEPLFDLRPVQNRMSDEQFTQLVNYLSGKYGLRIPPEKKILIESRLSKRITALNLRSVQEYLDFIFKSENAHTEYPHFIDHITTHKTFFFRENYQFDFIKNLLPEYCRSRNFSRLNIWSAGCSTGEEVYTLGIILQELKSDLSALDYKITGTDISIPSLQSAAKGFFNTELNYIPEEIKNKYFHQSVYNGRAGLQFSYPEITNRISLGVLNLNGKQYNLPNLFDFIFCRNVIIYFDAKTRNEVLHRLAAKLKPGGYLFLGHSETALGTDLPLRNIKPTIYQNLN